jgi:hypothetical protein
VALYDFFFLAPHSAPRYNPPSHYPQRGFIRMFREETETLAQLKDRLEELRRCL